MKKLKIMIKLCEAEIQNEYSNKYYCHHMLEISSFITPSGFFSYIWVDKCSCCIPAPNKLFVFSFERLYCVFRCMVYSSTWQDHLNFGFIWLSTLVIFIRHQMFNEVRGSSLVAAFRINNNKNMSKNANYTDVQGYSEVLNLSCVMVMCVCTCVGWGMEINCSWDRSSRWDTGWVESVVIASAVCNRGEGVADDLLHCVDHSL